jgi:formylmethanofuran dehydrogenase subunit E
MAEQRKLPKDLQQAVEFHGHLCPGLLIGYRATKAGLARLGVPEGRARDEELVAVVENDSCSVDAVQSLAGATFGKGNLVFRDYGKQAFTFYERAGDRGVRVVLKPGALFEPERDRARKQHDDKASSDLRERVVDKLLSASDAELFDFKEPQEHVPVEAQIRSTVVCARCGEGVMETRVRLVEGRPLCLHCFHEYVEGRPQGI